MADNKNQKAKPVEPKSNNVVWIAVGVIAVLAIIGILYITNKADRNSLANANVRTPPATTPTVTPPVTATTNNNAAPVTNPETKGEPELTTMDVAKAVMVTVEEDFGKNATIASALKQVERRYQPDDGKGRTFAVLDAYGETLPDGKVHMSMHISSEKPGTAQLIDKKTGKVLWKARINPVNTPPPPKALRMIIESSPGNGFNVDVASANNVLSATASGKGVPVANLWPDGEVMEVTFIYSMCGCPVKAKVKRVGDKTMRINDLPVMFPDDPDALQTIAKFMKWSS
ncbi:MAG: hypothetical protein HY231_21570 [Acidobacteria bacterium]|nr:hypothetical protein [Acidobacteriota bacterium]